MNKYDNLLENYAKTEIKDHGAKKQHSKLCG